MTKARDTANLVATGVPNSLITLDAAEIDGFKDIDILSNGFKCRSADGAVNTVSGNYIYAAFAEFPIVSSNDNPGVAR
jgi:hypothetical protein